MTASKNTFIGRSVPRTEDPRLLRGAGCFVDDIHRLGMVHAVIVRSHTAHGRLIRVDASRARSLPGVCAVFTAADIGTEICKIPFRIAPLEGADPFRQPVIASTRIRYVGEPIAVVIAETQAMAEDAAELVDVSIEEFDRVPDVTAACSGRSYLFPSERTNVASRYKAGRGDPEAAFAKATYTRRERFSVQRHTAMPMEMRGLFAEWNAEAGHMTVWGATKVPFFNRKTLTEMLGLPRQKVDLVEVDVGGAFGVRGEFYPEDFLIPFASKQLGRPVKWQEDRREHMMATNHSRETYCDVEIACSPDGLILAMRAQIMADVGAYVGTTGGILASRTGQFLAGPYRVPNVDLEILTVLTNKTPAGSYRGPGRFESSFFRERLLDMVARDLNIDAVEFRRRNLVGADELPYDIGQLVPYEGRSSYESGDYPGVLERCAEAIGWNEKARIRGQKVDGRYHGLGVGCFVDSSGAGPKENALLRVETDGSVSVSVGSSANGQGIETAHAQICADQLRIPMSKVSILHGSTTLLPEGFGSFHSRSIIMGGNAIVAAADNLVETLKAVAARHWGVPESDVTYDDGCLRTDGGKLLGFEDLARLVATPIEAFGSFGTKMKPFGYGTHAAHVAVDAETGQVEVLDYVAFEDIGRMINPMLVHGQKIGAIVQGLGGVFLEHLLYDDDAQLLTGSLADYLLPTAADFRNIRAVALDLTRTSRNPLGVKGVGEDSIAPVAGAIGNAIADALRSFGIEPRALPITPPALWRLLQT
jgi:aerobic carbon-monoxide dehydrogenase large subunit